MKQDALLATLLDLDVELAGHVDLIVGGGYGLYLKQLHLQEHTDIRTLFPVEALPPARTTQDIDLILRAEVVTDGESMRPIREALDRLGFEVVDTAKYMQFARESEAGTVKIDLLAGPLGEFADRVPKDSRRVRPRPRVQLHAHKMDEAVAVEDHPFPIEVTGQRSSGEKHTATLLVPQAFSYLMMKLTAFRDRLHDEDKDLGRHHALDAYRIVGLLTQDEDRYVRELSREHADHAAVIEVREIATRHFVDPEGIGRIRIREHPLASQDIDLERFAGELRDLFAPNA